MTATVEHEPERSVRFGPQEDDGVIGGLSAPAIVFMGGGIVLAFFAITTLPGTVSLLVAGLVLGVFAAIVKLNIRAIGGTLFDRTPTLVRYALRPKLWAPTYRAAQLRRYGDGRYVIESPPPSLPPELVQLQLLALSMANGGEVAVVKDRKTGTFVVTMRVQQQAFLLRSAADQERLFDQWADATRVVVGDPDSPIDRLAVYERTLPDPSDDLWSTFHRNEHARTLEGTDPWEAYVDLLRKAGPSTQAHESFVSLRLNPRKGNGRRAIRDAGGGDEGAMRVAYGWAARLGEVLSHSDGLSVTGVLHPAGMARLIREAFDPAWRQVGQPDRGMAATVPLSSGTLEAADRYRTDSAVHRTYEVVGYPREPHHVLFLSPLIVETGAPRSFTLVFEPIDRDQSRTALRARASTEKAKRQRHEDADLYLDPSADDAVAHHRRLAIELGRGEYELRFRGYCTVTSPDDDHLDAMCSNVTYAAGQAGLELQALRFRQARGFTYSLPLCLGLPAVSKLRQALGA